MFWILGADALVRALEKMTANPVTGLLGAQLSHVDWAGFHFYDLIFPLFVFIAGVSSVWSLTKEREKHGPAGAARRVIRRGMLLVVLGIFYSGGLGFEWPNIRVLGVLQRIGLAYLVAGLLFLGFRPRALAGICAGLLVGYWGLMTFVPIRDIALERSALARLATARGEAATAELFQDDANPSATRNHPAWLAARAMYDSTTNHVTGRFEKGLNVANHVDFRFLPGKRYDHYWDPEGLLSTLGGIASCLLGILAGVLLRGPRSDQEKVLRLAAWGLAGIVAGSLWSFQFPIIKKVWSSSFVLVAGGCSALFLALFYQVVEIWQRRAWCQPFVWIGMNSITVYLANNIIGFRKLAERFVGGDIKAFLDTRIAAGTGDLLLAVTGLGLGVLLCWFLHRRKIFLRL